MPEFSIAWNRRRLSWYKRSESAPWMVEAVLCERALIEGRPAISIIARLAGIIEDRVNDPAAVDQFWHDAQRKLGKLRRLGQRDRWQIETLIAARIPKAGNLYRDKCPGIGSAIRPGANPIRGPHQPIERVLRAR
jgi:hypothetical protein